MKPFALIATGNITEAKRTQQALLDLGFQVEVVTTGARAQVQLAFSTPDLIILDMNLPDMPGEVVLRQINAQRRLDTTALILLSTGVEFPSQPRRLAAATTIAHPVNPDALAALAANLAGANR
jgi:DNA-binding response OmpR family regulator